MNQHTMNHSSHKMKKNLQKLLKRIKNQIKWNYHYDEKFLHENGINTVRLAIIDAVTNPNINDQVIYQENFNKKFVEIFLKYSWKDYLKKY